MKILKELDAFTAGEIARCFSARRAVLIQNWLSAQNSGDPYVTSDCTKFWAECIRECNDAAITIGLEVLTHG